MRVSTNSEEEGEERIRPALPLGNEEEKRRVCLTHFVDEGEGEDGTGTVDYENGDLFLPSDERFPSTNALESIELRGNERHDALISTSFQKQGSARANSLLQSAQSACL